MNDYKKKHLKQIKKTNKKINILNRKIKRKLIKNNDFNTINILNSYSKYSAFYYFLTNLSTFSEEIKKYIINDILCELNGVGLLNNYLILICNYKTKKDFNKMKITMDSLNISGLIKKIKYDSNKDFFTLTLKNNEIIIFKEKHTEEDEIYNTKNQCHYITQDEIEKDYLNKTLYAVTVCISDLNNNINYHSFIVQDEIVYDSAHNIIISFEDYKKLYDPEIILYIEGKTLIRNINRFKDKNDNFQNNNVELFNYAMYKKRKKDKRLIRSSN